MRALTLFFGLGVAVFRADSAAILVDTAFSASGIACCGAQYDVASVSLSLDPASTNWVAWNSTPTVSRTDGSFPGQFFLWGGGGFGTDDFIRITVTNPLGATLSVDLDKNDAFGAHLVPTDPMNVIFGSAAAAPNALRIDAFGSTAGTKRVFNEAGAFNSIFTAAGTYNFTFSFRNAFTTAGGHSDVYLLTDITPTEVIAPVPEPGTGLLVASMLAALGWRVRRRLV